MFAAQRIHILEFLVTLRFLLSCLHTYWSTSPKESCFKSSNRRFCVGKVVLRNFAKLCSCAGVSFLIKLKVPGDCFCVSPFRFPNAMGSLSFHTSYFTLIPQTTS